MLGGSTYREEMSESARPGPARLTRRTAVSLGCLLGGVSLLLVGLWWRGSEVVWSAPKSPAGAVAGTAPLPLSSLRLVGAELVPNPLLQAAKGAQFARALSGWGAAGRFRTAVQRVGTVRVTPPVSADTPPPSPPHVQTVEAVTFPAGDTGGVWFTVPVKAGTIYEQRYEVDVVSLSHGAHIEFRLEWYPSAAAGAAPSGAVATQVYKKTNGYVEIDVAGRAPAGSRVAHIVANVVGGGEILVAGASLREAVRR